MTTEETVGKTVKMWDIRDLQNPILASEWLASDSSIAHNVYVLHNVAYISHYADSFRMLDISDPYNMYEVAFHNPDNSSWGAFGGFHSGNFIHGGTDALLYIMGIAEGIIPVHRSIAFKGPLVQVGPGGRLEFVLPDGGTYKLELVSSLGKTVQQFQGTGVRGLNSVFAGFSNMTSGYYTAIVNYNPSTLKTMTYTHPVYYRK